MKKLAILLLIFSPALFAEGEYPSKMEGLYYIWGDPIDKNDKPGVEGFTIFLEGEAAERLFTKLKLKLAIMNAGMTVLLQNMPAMLSVACHQIKNTAVRSA